MVGKCMHVGAKEPLRDNLNPSPWRDLVGHIKPSWTTRAGGKQETQHTTCMRMALGPVRPFPSGACHKIPALGGIF